MCSLLCASHFNRIFCLSLKISVDWSAQMSPNGIFLLISVLNHCDEMKIFGWPKSNPCTSAELYWNKIKSDLYGIFLSNLCWLHFENTRCIEIFKWMCWFLARLDVVRFGLFVHIASGSSTCKPFIFNQIKMARSLSHSPHISSEWRKSC